MKKKVQKKLRLRKWVKVVATLLVVLLGIFLYNYLKKLGAEQTEQAIAFCCIGWFYLFFVQVYLLDYLWEK